MTTTAIVFSRFTEQTFYEDWRIPGYNGEDYTSYMDTFFHIVEDDMLWMDAPYVYTYLENDVSGILGDQTTKSLKVQVGWDWAKAD